MFYALSWIAVISLLALWSLAAWGLHAVAAWTVASAGALTGSASGVASLRLPEWLAPWLPPEIVQWMIAMLAGLGPVVDGLLQGTPALAAGLTVLTWVVWGIGAVLLVAVGAGAHVLIAMWRRRGGGSGLEPARAGSTG